MKGLSHLMLGGLTGAAYATAQGSPLSTVVAAGLVASATSRGPLSPDGDQSEPSAMVRPAVRAAATSVVLP